MFLIPPSSYTIKTLKKKGRGVFAARDLEPGTVIGDYLGTIMHPDKENEKKDGLYSMGAGEKYDILGNPKVKGIHFVNHSCANNCDVYPYQGHLLFFTLRKIFKGEELSINYWLSPGDDEDITCAEHACYCGSKLCKGTMHDPAINVDDWERLVKKEFGARYKKVPGKYGTQFQPLASYPQYIRPQDQSIYHYDIFGSESKPAAMFQDASIPTALELEKRIRESGRQLSFPKLHLGILGTQNNILLARREK
jgi:hypothetical protein